jgi:hypothetical protein
MLPNQICADYNDQQDCTWRSSCLTAHISQIQSSQFAGRRVIAQMSIAATYWGLACFWCFHRLSHVDFRIAIASVKIYITKPGEQPFPLPNGFFIAINQLLRGVAQPHPAVAQNSTY